MGILVFWMSPGRWRVTGADPAPALLREMRERREDTKLTELIFV
jgi:hypothetical protein